MRMRKPAARTAVATASFPQHAESLEAGKLVCAALVLAIALVGLRIAALW